MLCKHQKSVNYCLCRNAKKGVYLRTGVFYTKKAPKAPTVSTEAVIYTFLVFAQHSEISSDSSHLRQFFQPRSHDLDPCIYDIVFVIKPNIPCICHDFKDVALIMNMMIWAFLFQRKYLKPCRYITITIINLKLVMLYTFHW